MRSLDRSSVDRVSERRKKTSLLVVAVLVLVAILFIGPTETKRLRHEFPEEDMVAQRKKKRTKKIIATGVAAGLLMGFGGAYYLKGFEPSPPQPIGHVSPQHEIETEPIEKEPIPIALPIAQEESELESIVEAPIIPIIPPTGGEYDLDNKAHGYEPHIFVVQDGILLLIITILWCILIIALLRVCCKKIRKRKSTYGKDGVAVNQLGMKYTIDEGEGQENDSSSVIEKKMESDYIPLDRKANPVKARELMTDDKKTNQLVTLLKSPSGTEKELSIHKKTPRKGLIPRTASYSPRLAKSQLGDEHLSPSSENKGQFVFHPSDKGTMPFQRLNSEPMGNFSRSKSLMHKRRQSVTVLRRYSKNFIAEKVLITSPIPLSKKSSALKKRKEKMKRFQFCYEPVLRYIFSKIDSQKRGYVSENDFIQLYQSMAKSGHQYVDQLCEEKKWGRDKKVSFEEFFELVMEKKIYEEFSPLAADFAAACKDKEYVTVHQVAQVILTARQFIQNEFRRVDQKYNGFLHFKAFKKLIVNLYDNYHVHLRSENVRYFMHMKNIIGQIDYSVKARVSQESFIPVSSAEVSAGEISDGSPMMQPRMLSSPSR
eukprot:CAMPEP_0167752490 /NCGR_PEP_ID=MMETSP0110_2-20121227/7169_1 /TAXON_ID=629695 /ORGANISM="Gymnochlora sp., Strain CCMP2014" /LENGTH=597 /DNA_ID=CAMNT_0007638115 /DNA_START=119 /DNA_END=1912 /DNA_ORIENTATION=-